MSATTRAWRAHGYGSAATQLRLDTIPLAQPGPGELRLRLAAASLNPIDYKLLHGDLKRVMAQRFPTTIGFDGAGTVDAVGEGVAGFAVGDRVFVRASRETIGTFAETCVQPARFAAHLPASLDFAGAASLPLVALTTVQGLVDRAQARAGQRILIHAGSGGLGTFAIQYVKALGLEVDTTTSSRNAEWVAALGADRVIAYDREDYRALGAVYDIVFDTLGGEHTLRSFEVLKPGGTVVSVAGPPDAQMRAKFAGNPLARFAMWLMARGVHAAAAGKGARYFRFLTESDGAQLQAVADLAASGAIRPVVDRAFEFGDLVAAFEYLETGRAKGKVVLDVAANPGDGKLPGATAQAPLLVATVGGVELCRVLPAEVPCEKTPSLRVEAGSRLEFTDAGGATQVHVLGPEGGWFHFSVRVHANLACQVDCVVTDSERFDPAEGAQAVPGIRFQPFFLAGAAVDNASFAGQGMFARGLHYSGLVTRGDARLSCVCDRCRRSFLLQGFHTGFGQCGYFYSGSGRYTLVVSNDIAGSPAALSTPPPVALAELEARLPSAPDGSRFAYLNPLRCPHCAAPYVDFAAHPGLREAEYYGHQHLGTELLHFAPGEA